MAGAERASLFTIPSWRPFADDLAAGLLAEFPDPLSLSRVLLLLPTRRSIRALLDAFLRESGGRALLLPRMVAAGDLDSGDPNSMDDSMDATSLEGGPLFDTLSGPAELRPALSPMGKRLALARLLAAGGRPAAEALALAGRLAAALDTLEIEGKGPADLAGAVPAGELQQHWQKNAEILALVQRQWPELLAARGLMDATERRNLQLETLAGRWLDSPPQHPVLLAGFAAAPPAVARLAHRVARLPRGRLVLPGLDLAMPEEARARLAPDAEGRMAETHPQFGMHALLRTAGLAAAEALPWPHRSARPGGSAARSALVARSQLPPGFDLRPADSGVGPAGAAAGATAGLRMVEVDNPAEEALLIALAMRQLVERPGLTAALVTPDRTLARRVAVQLSRFAITVDDSAGAPLDSTGPGSLLVALAAAAGERFAPVALLGLLQHPLVLAGEQRLSWLSDVRALDLHALRGIRPRAGLAGITERLRQNRRRPDTLPDWWRGRAAPLLAPLEPLPKTAAQLLDTLRQVAEQLAGEALWTNEAGRALARFFDSIEESRDDLARLPVTAGDAAPFTAALLHGETVRPRWSLHPQLHIWGPLEARLQTADLMILGGLNEKSWPAAAAPDPFLAPAIRRALGLSGLARRIGLQAQDFAAGLGGREVLLTRALRAGGAPTIPSRFWQRLQTAAGTDVLPDSGALLPATAALLAAVRALDRPQSAPPFERPAPAPPAAARPKEISVTDVAMLKADPFSFYAKRLLRLSPLDPRDAEPTAGERGRVVHSILERLLDEQLPPAPRLQQLVDEELQHLGERPEIAALWRPRVLRMVEWAVERILEDGEWQPAAWERRASLAVGGVMLVGQVDRLDRAGTRLRVVDYKTGALPQVGEVDGLYQTQLALLALLADKGCFGDFGGDSGAGRVQELHYWQLSGVEEPGEIRPALGRKAAPHATTAHIGAAADDFHALTSRFLLGDQPFTAKLHLVHGRRFRDYDHLARVAEWLGR